MSEWTSEEMAEGLRSFSGTDTRERFYDACADRIEHLSSEISLLREALIEIRGNPEYMAAWNIVDRVRARVSTGLKQ